MVKLQRTKTAWLCVIPSDLVKLTGWQKGDQLVVTAGKHGCLEIKKV